MSNASNIQELLKIKRKSFKNLRGKWSKIIHQKKKKIENVPKHMKKIFNVTCNKGNEN